MKKLRERIPNIFLVLLIIVIFVIVAEGLYFGFKVKKTQEAIPSVFPAQMGAKYTVEKKLEVYESPDESTRFGYLAPGKTFVILEKKEDWVKFKLVMEGGWGWFKADSTSYRQVE